MLLIVRKINYRKVIDYYWLFYGISIFSLIYTLLNGVVVNGSKRWISLGIVNIQPSEFVKIILILFVAAYIEKKDKEVFHIKNLIQIGLLLGIPAFLIFSQPDLGTSLLFLPTVFIIFWYNGLPLRYTLFILISGSLMVLIPIISTYSKEIATRNFYLKVIISPEYLFYLILFFVYFTSIVKLANIKFKKVFLNLITFYTLSICIGLIIGYIIDNHILKEYQRERLIVFLNPYDHQWGSGYNIVQSQITIGSGGFWGKGLFNGNYSQLGFLPSRTTDFVFSVIAEEMGFLGTSVILFLFFFMLLRIWKMIDSINDNAGKNIVIGIFFLLTLQIVINIGMTLSLFPVTGIPLPFISAGGSTLISSLLGIGIIFSIQSKRWVNSNGNHIKIEAK